jgi:hypothetical protein
MFPTTPVELLMTICLFFAAFMAGWYFPLPKRKKKNK